MCGFFSRPRGHTISTPPSVNDGRGCLGCATKPISLATMKCLWRSSTRRPLHDRRKRRIAPRHTFYLGAISFVPGHSQISEDGAGQSHFGSYLAFPF
jgi:hypothetical protein